MAKSKKKEAEPTTFGGRLASLRKKGGLTIRQFARALSVSPEEVEALEINRTDWLYFGLLARITKWARRHGSSIEWLLTGEERPKSTATRRKR